MKPCVQASGFGVEKRGRAGESNNVSLELLVRGERVEGWLNNPLEILSMYTIRAFGVLVARVPRCVTRCRLRHEAQKGGQSLVPGH
ncbi:hypothetical protein E2C01_016793 [Portunus trituberculatus]|uniref:Uncharacterized protein n=1 Tax=Portunus trituberculatus TaxID=210409 RepID=A0A5B7DQ08_PORTR|nr:hypothetical protein [Portunus trituberculatus]